ncbi:hypothetical protein Tco_1483591 [Tanacetum coccineum]
MANLSEDIQCAGSDTRPPMLDRTDFASWQQRIRLYCRGKENGVNILKSIDEGPFQMGTFRETLAEGNEGALHLGPERPRVYSDLSPEDKERYNADIRATNILLQGLPKDIYSLINHYTDAKDICVSLNYIKSNKNAQSLSLAKPGPSDKPIRLLEGMGIKETLSLHGEGNLKKPAKKRITPTGLTEGERGFEQTKALTKEIKEMKDIFEELEAEDDQNIVHRKHAEIERKPLLIANDNLIADCLSKDMFYITTNSELTVSRNTEMHDAHTVV